MFFMMFEESLFFVLSFLPWFQQQDSWRIRLSNSLYRPIHSVPYRNNAFRCHAFQVPGKVFELPVVKAASIALTRSYNILQDSPLVFKLAPAVGIIIFAVCGVVPLMQHSRSLLLHRSDNSWKKSRTHYVTTSYIQPLLLWTGAILICRTLDPLVLPTEASQLVKQRLLNFVQSLSTVLAFAYCLSRLALHCCCTIQQTQKFFMETSEISDTRNVGKALYSAVWVAAVSLFMELLGFSTQRWLTAGGLGTVLLTLAGREIFTNFLSSAMIHATRPFVVNEWIQTKIEGYEVSGTVENIVADMRKVLAKNPQVEQQRLHRRVFLENVSPENQALLILVSCFVKTSHLEEYLCVKEAILLDLLRVISHHRARLATPIRTVQKVVGDSELENVPFADSIYNHGGVSSNRPLLLIEPAYKINGEDRTKGRSAQPAGEQDSKTTVRPAADNKAGATPKPDSKSKADAKVVESPNSETKASNASFESTSHPKTDDKVKPPSKSTQKMSSNAAETSSPDQKVLDNKRVSDKQQKVARPSVSTTESGIDKAGGLREPFQSKPEGEKLPVSALEENIVLGVALEGSKRTLPIDEEMTPRASEAKELASTSRNGTGSSAEDKKGGQIRPTSGNPDDQ
ncbi:Mechanosensitive ion channel 2, chloroplastic-like protein [Gossypium australe]|uniref:Mechanosensitive ion channel 2, chloroplastic-like protein n=1 Tax=Gossypium australe TaxID=47621 RepID=A0A5B6UKN6_9ROSI|nr:Mechanosensitive ion channel 2, chloroplastic-like protein [Gossypium australe]